MWIDVVENHRCSFVSNIADYSRYLMQFPDVWILVGHWLRQGALASVRRFGSCSHDVLLRSSGSSSSWKWRRVDKVTSSSICKRCQVVEVLDVVHFGNDATSTTLVIPKSIGVNSSINLFFQLGNLWNAQWSSFQWLIYFTRRVYRSHRPMQFPQCWWVHHLTIHPFSECYVVFSSVWHRCLRVSKAAVHHL